jgi:hypothetical protein
MPTKIVLLEDGTRIEVEAQSDDVVKISGGHLKPIPNTAIKQIQPILSKVIASCDEIKKNINIEKTEIELGLSFQGEGSIYITKAKASANLLVRLTIKS